MVGRVRLSGDRRGDPPSGGRPGGLISGDLLGRPRFLNLSIRATRKNATGGLTAPTPPEQLVDNTDTFLGLLQQPRTLLELDMPDTTTRFLTVTALDPFPIQATQTGTDDDRPAGR